MRRNDERWVIVDPKKKSRLWAALLRAVASRRAHSYERSSRHLRSSKFPVGKIPECLDIFRPRVAVVDVVGVLPDVAREQRTVGAGDWRGGVAGTDQAEASVRALHQPGPARTERSDGGLAEIFLELREAAEALLDRIGQLARRFAAALRREAVPVERVIPDLRGVVEHAALRFLDDRHEVEIFELGTLDQVVEIGHMGLVVLAIVIVERFGGDVRRQGVACVGKRG